MAISNNFTLQVNFDFESNKITLTNKEVLEQIKTECTKYDHLQMQVECNPKKQGPNGQHVAKFQIQCEKGKYVDKASWFTSLSRSNKTDAVVAGFLSELNQSTAKADNNANIDISGWEIVAPETPPKIASTIDLPISQRMTQQKLLGIFKDSQAVDGRLKNYTFENFISILDSNRQWGNIFESHIGRSEIMESVLTALKNNLTDAEKLSLPQEVKNTSEALSGAELEAMRTGELVETTTISIENVARLEDFEKHTPRVYMHFICY